MDSSQVPVITIDGPSGTGKGTITHLLADALRWHVLDSGAIYRAVAWIVLKQDLDLQDENLLMELLATVDIQLISEFPGVKARVYCNAVEITQRIREEVVGMMASKVSALPCVRHSVLKMQRDFRVSPGLVADGRDMGTIVFPDATLKFYLDASPSERINRRFNQLKRQGVEITLQEVQNDLLIRDQQDVSRAIAPLVPAEDAHVIDTTNLTIEQVFTKVMAYVHKFIL